MGFLNSPVYVYLKKTEPIFTLRNLSCRKYSSHKLPQVSQGKNVLDSPASKTNVFLSRDISVSSTQLKDLFCTKKAYLQLEKCKLQEVFLTETNSVLTG
jgi:hypothetical protein